MDVRDLMRDILFDASAASDLDERCVGYLENGGAERDLGASHDDYQGLGGHWPFFRDELADSVDGGCYHPRSFLIPADQENPCREMRRHAVRTQFSEMCEMSRGRIKRQEHLECSFCESRPAPCPVRQRVLEHRSGLTRVKSLRRLVPVD